MIESYPGLYRTLQTYLRERVKEVLSGASESIVVRVFGPDVDVLTTKAEEIAAQMATIDGFVDPHVEQIEQIPQIEVRSRRRGGARYGITPGTSAASRPRCSRARRSPTSSTKGRRTTSTCGAYPTARDSVSDVENLPIDTPDGGQVPLHAVADIAIRPVANTIKHERQTRRVDAAADLGERDLASAVDELNERLADSQFHPATTPRCSARHPS